MCRQQKKAIKILRITKEIINIRGRDRASLSLGLLLLLGLASLALRLDVLVVHSQGLVDLGLESALVLDPVGKLELGCSNWWGRPYERIGKRGLTS